MGSAKELSGIGPEKGAPKAMKAMKAMKVLKLVLKRPSAQKTPNPKGEGMSLEEKMDMYQKKNNWDMNSFLDGLTKQQREALWQRFANARASLKDGEADAMWNEVAKGQGSDPAKKKLLSCFLKLGGELKGKRDQWCKELMTYTKSSGHLLANHDFE